MNCTHCKEIVICSAVKTTTGEIIRGHRHNDCMLVIKAMQLEVERKPDSQRFITSRNRFVTRTEGRELQDAAGIESVGSNGYIGQTLFSEDIY